MSRELRTTVTMRPAETLVLHVLGRGRVEARIERCEEMRWHGMPSLARRITLRIDASTVVEALQVGEGGLIFADPRVTGPVH